MAQRKKNNYQKTLEYIVSDPIKATLLVGSSILALQQLIAFVSQYLESAAYFMYLIPFIPPFFITRVAKQINQARIEYDFVKDAEPYIFVAFPKEATMNCLLETKAQVFSNSAERHFNVPNDELLTLEALPEECIKLSTRQKITTDLVDGLRLEGRGVIRNRKIEIKPKGSDESNTYLMNSVLKRTERGLKWQATFVQFS